MVRLLKTPFCDMLFPATGHREAGNARGGSLLACEPLRSVLRVAHAIDS